MRVLAALATALLLSGCATRSVHQPVVDAYGLEVKLRSEKALFGETLGRGFQHPAVVSAPRLAAILRGIEIDTRKSEDSPIAERRTAIAESILDEVAAGLSQAFAQAGPDQSIVVLAQRKQMQKGIFNRKYLTSFVSYIRDDELYVFVSRVDWKIDVGDSSKRLPEPWPNDGVMPFRTVPNELYQPAGAQGVRVAWRRPEFGEPRAASPPGPPAAGTPRAAAPEEGATGAEAPAGGEPEASGAAPAGATAGSGAAAGAAVEATGADLSGLSPAALRELADIEEAFRAGRIDEREYRRQRGLVLERER